MTITGTVVRTWLHGARLPITIAEAALHRRDRAGEWPPALAFGAFEASVKQVVGSLVRDQDLAREGRLERVEVSQLRKAATLEAIAETREQEADAEVQARLEADEERKRRVHEEAEARRRDTERKAAEEKRRADKQARSKAKTAERAEAATDKAVAEVERSARAERVRAERGALAKERQAVTAKKTVARVDDELQTAKTARKSARS